MATIYYSAKAQCSGGVLHALIGDASKEAGRVLMMYMIFLMRFIIFLPTYQPI